MNTTAPLVSVILPCYNAAEFLESSVRSIMDQTYQALEIIVIDDSSTDATPVILKVLSEKDKRIKSFRNEKNSGLVVSLNKGILNASGKYIARMDADDISLPYRIEKQVNFMEKNVDVALCGGNYFVIDNNGKPIGKILFSSDDATLKAELLFMCPIGHPTVMIRKNVLNKIGTYQDGLVPAEDYELWIRIAEEYKIANLPDYLIQYRVHGGNITITQRDNQINKFEQILQNHSASFGYAESFISYHVKFLGGAWNRSTSKKEIDGFVKWKQALIEKNEKLHLTKQSILLKTFYKYYSNALLSILKSNVNSYELKLYAFSKLIFINPLITINHFVRKYNVE